MEQFYHICQSLPKQEAGMQWQKHNQRNIVCPNNRMQAGRHARQIRFKIHHASEILRAAAKRMNQLKFFAGKSVPACVRILSVLMESFFIFISCCQKGWAMMRHISETCRCHGIRCCIPYRKNSRFAVPGNVQNGYDKAGFAVERFPCLAQVRVEKDCGKA